MLSVVSTLTRRRLMTAAVAATRVACARDAGVTIDDDLLIARPAENQWPPELLKRPVDVQEMYRYAAANRETLRYIPCFCGCVEGGHRDNFDCYVREVFPDGRIRLDVMSFG